MNVMSMEIQREILNQYRDVPLISHDLVLNDDEGEK